MKNYTLLYLPLDERPCNSRFLPKIADGTPIKVLSPSLDTLGNKKQPADFEKVKKFLTDNASAADACVVSVDMLLYGGIVPSRLHSLSEKELNRRLQTLWELKKLNPRLKLYGFSMIMRCPSYNSDDEEPDYYERCGKQIFEYGQTLHKMNKGLLPEQSAVRRLKELEQVIGEKELADFVNRRKINLQMLLSLLANNPCDYFVIPQDDSAEYGFTTADRETVKAFIRKHNLNDVPTYPGADEVGMTLAAHAACDLTGKRPSVYCRWTTTDAMKVIPLYEDRPVGQTVPLQIEVSGAKQTFDKESCDVELFLNYPSSSPVEVYQTPSSGYFTRDLDQFTADVAAAVKQGKTVVIADGAYANGGDLELVQKLSKVMDITELPSYAGWNTSSNTLGTAICQAIFVWLFGQSENSKLFVAERYAEDVAYCGYVRRYVSDNVLPQMGLNYFDAGAIDGAVAQRVWQEIDRYLSVHLPQVAAKYRVSSCRMPWKRMFEVDLCMQKIR